MVYVKVRGENGRDGERVSLTGCCICLVGKVILLGVKGLAGGKEGRYTFLVDHERKFTDGWRVRRGVQDVCSLHYGKRIIG